MPCDTQYLALTRGDFDPQQPELLKKAVERLGWILTSTGSVHTITGDGYTLTIANGQAQCRSRSEAGAQAAINKLRSAYSDTIIDQASQWAKAKGWEVNKSGNKVQMRKL